MIVLGGMLWDLGRWCTIEPNFGQNKLLPLKVLESWSSDLSNAIRFIQASTVLCIASIELCQTKWANHSESQTIHILLKCVLKQPTLCRAWHPIASSTVTATISSLETLTLY
jgi:hypothetical protein